MGTTHEGDVVLPGSTARWGPNLWLVHRPGSLRLSGDGRFGPAELARLDVAPLLDWSSTGSQPSGMRPEVVEALRLRGWDPTLPDRSRLAGIQRRRPVDLLDWTLSDAPKLIRIVGCRATAWDHLLGRAVELTRDELTQLAGTAPSAPEAATSMWTHRQSVPDPRPLEVAAVHVPAVAPRRHPGDTRVPVWFGTCARGPDGNPLALGMIQSALRAHADGRLLDTHDLRPIRVDAASVLSDVHADGRPGILMLSNFHWTVEANLRLAARVCAAQPGTVVVVGGPSAPKYEDDAERFFEQHPYVDVIVRGEGEVTASELVAALDGDLARLDRLTEVQGLTVKVAGRLVRTADRDRMADPNIVPSPYLTGVFDHLTGMEGIWAVETNRGCPYACTFCDWGSATMSRVRKFDLERVLAELEWLAENDIAAVFLADANFGMFRRDVEIAQHVADLRRRHEAPGSFIACFAKNTTKNTLPIVEILQQAGLHTEATLSFQTVDEQTLINVKRQNVKHSVYDELTVDARERGLPVLSDMMLGLPGMSLETLKSDFEHCMHGEVTARFFGTLVLPNSPMNDPEYRAEHGIEVDSELQLVGAKSFSRAEREEMIRFRDTWRVVEHFGVLREVLRFARDETGRRAVDVLWDLYETSLGEPDRYPLLSWFFSATRRHLTVPMGWSPFFGEVSEMLTERLGIKDSTGLSIVLSVQEALLPAPGRRFPCHLVLAHDYLAYRYQDRQDGVTRLCDFGPGELTIDDPDDKCSTALRDLELLWTSEGHRWLIEEIGFMDDHNWELESPLSRKIRGLYLTRRSESEELQARSTIRASTERT